MIDSIKDSFRFCTSLLDSDRRNKHTRMLKVISNIELSEIGYPHFRNYLIAILSLFIVKNNI